MADLSQVPTDQLVQMLAQHPAVQAAPAPPPQSVGDKAKSIFQGVRQGLYDLPQSAIELGARATDALGLSNGAYTALHNEFKSDASMMAPGINDANGYAKGGRIAGQVAGTLPLTELKIGGALAEKLPLLAKVGSGVAQGATASALTSTASDAPLGDQVGLGAAVGGAIPLALPALKAVGGIVPTVLGQTTGAGSAAVRNAFQAGRAGGDTAATFLGNLRGDIPWSQVVDDAKTALGNMRAQRGAAYRAGMSDVSKDATVLSFDPVDQAMNKAASVKNFKGQDLSPKTAGVRSEIQDTIDQWKALDPSEYHTPEGFDALKQKIGDIRDSAPYGTPARTVADTAYNAVKGAIVEQAPTYSKVMQGYSQASDELAALQKELSLGPKGNPNTALRKLQSIMRDNANTSWGDRAKYGARLADSGATDLMPALSGQALSTAVPRGLTKYADAAALLPAIMHNPLLAPATALASPRLVGEGAYALGAANRGATALGRKIPLQLPSLPQLSPTAGLLAPALAYQN